MTTEPRREALAAALPIAMDKTGYGNPARFADAILAALREQGFDVVRLDSGGVLPDGTTNTPAIDFDVIPPMTEVPVGGLDVERLARALVKATREQAGEPNGKGWPGYVRFGKPRDVVVTLVVSDLAEQVAREYAKEADHG